MGESLKDAGFVGPQLAGHDISIFAFSNSRKYEI
jgi:hypothetical protein